MKRLLLFALFALAARAGGETYTSPELGFTFPEKLAGMEMQGIVDYEKQSPGSGTGVDYFTPGRKADFYIYKAGPGSVPDGVSSPEIKQHFNLVKNVVVRMEEKGLYRNVSFPIPSEIATIGNLEFLHSEMAYDQDGAPRVSHIYLTVLQGQYLKIRYTIAAKDVDPVAALRKFLADTALVLTAKNTF